MNRQISIYLDLVRFGAALVVFAGHISLQRLTGGSLWQFALFGDDAVVVFFVLSGFVIAHVTSQKESTASAYGIARAARMYSVALPALLCTFLLDQAGSMISPEAYSAAWGDRGEHSLLQYLAGMFFVHQLWYLDISIGSMLPYWSLGYEVWYYLIFAAGFFARGSTRPLLVAGACLIAGPKILVLFPLWLGGYYAYKFVQDKKANVVAGSALWILSLAAYGLYVVGLKGPLSAYPFAAELFGKNLIDRYIVGILFALNLIGFAGASTLTTRIFATIEKPVRWLAGATFTIYLFHLPIAQFLAAIAPAPLSSWSARLLVMGGTLALTLLIAEVTERRKSAWQLRISACCNRVASAWLRSASVR